MLLFYVQLKSPEIMSYNWLGREGLRKRMIVLLDQLCQFYIFLADGWSSSLGGCGLWTVKCHPGGCIQWQWWRIFVCKTMAECDGGSGDLNIPVETVRVSQLIVILTLSPPHPHYLTTFYWLLTSNHHLCLPVIKNSSAGPASLN